MADSDPTMTTSERLKTVRLELRWNPRRRRIMEELAALMSAVDVRRLEALRRRHAEGVRGASAVSLQISRCRILHGAKTAARARSRPGRGTSAACAGYRHGGGHFPFVCQFLGHEVVGIDIEIDLYEGVSWRPAHNRPRRAAVSRRHGTIKFILTSPREIR